MGTGSQDWSGSGVGQERGWYLGRPDFPASLRSSEIRSDNKKPGGGTCPPPGSSIGAPGWSCGGCCPLARLGGLQGDLPFSSGPSARTFGSHPGASTRKTRGSQCCHGPSKSGRPGFPASLRSSEIRSDNTKPGGGKNPPPGSSVGAPGFEPGTFGSQSRRATGLRHAPLLLVATS